MGSYVDKDGKYQYRADNIAGDRGFIPGTEDMWQHPDIVDLPYTHDVYKGKGLIHYGAVKYKGESVYRIGDLNSDVAQLQSIGWVIVKPASLGGYVYMRKPA